MIVNTFLERMKLIFNLDADIDAMRPVDELYDSYEVHECGRGVLAFVCLLFIHGYISNSFFFIDTILVPTLPP